MLNDKDPLHIKRLSRIEYKTGVKKEAVEMAVKIISEYIKDKMSIPDLPENLTEEEFNELMPILTVYGLGYFTPSYKKYKYIQKSKEKKLKQDKNE